ncbi:sulfotransferase [Desulfovibrio sp. JC010]|uniref:sulfotransferase family protein n=1 Tax=Desulfovibrio sp. JC010 TaxID=2593641 RepID=UPI0013D4A3A8|nr:sulfotransferase [Desulfovibrio sp. JC010]NDV27497.1 sulfotransferase [Desulfovibrio sp. JC010]
METKSGIPASLSGTPVLIGGWPRSGTSLLTAMLGCAPGHVQGYELHLRKPSFVTGLSGRYTRNIFSSLGLNGEEYDAVCAGIDLTPMNLGAWTGPVDFVSGEEATGLETGNFSGEFFARAYLADRLMNRLAELQQAGSWGFKILGDAAYAEEYSRVWPEARFVMIHRDPRDSLPSTLKHLMPQLCAEDGDNSSGLRRLAEDWLFTVTSWLKFSARPDVQSMDIRYEDLVTLPGEILEGLASFLQMDLSGALDFYCTDDTARQAGRYDHLAGLRRPLHADGIGSGRRGLSSGEEAAILDVCADTMSILDYVD